jgi:serine/threonine-protein kinase
MVGEAAGIGLRSAGAYGGVPYLELDLARGESLAERIERTQGLPPNQVFAIVRQLLQRLDAIHEAGIVHRDIKPGNIVVGGGEGRALEVAVVDFGIATKAHAADLSEEDAMSGTAPYMGPEHMFRLGDIDGRMDLWSAAVVAYECLTGRPAFGNESLGLICLAVDAGQYIPPSQFVPSLPPAVDAWFARAFRRNILARFQCARDMERAWVSAHAATIGRRDTPPMAMPPRTRMAA